MGFPTASPSFLPPASSKYPMQELLLKMGGGVYAEGGGGGGGGAYTRDLR